MKKLSNWLSILIATIWLQKQCDCTSFPRKDRSLFSDAAVYPGTKKTSLQLLYSEAGDFSNLAEAVKEEGFLSMGLFCVKRGSFILYKSPQFNIYNSDDFKIVSGKDRCFRPTGLFSAQPIGPISGPEDSSISFFSKPYFASVSRPTGMNVRRAFFTTMRSSVKSIILVGRQNWTLVTVKGKKFCLRPKFDKKEKLPICLLPDIKQTKLGKRGVYLNAVRKGCKEDVVGKSIIDLGFCQYWGSVPNVTKESPMIFDTEVAGRSGSDRCSAGGDEEEKLKQTLTILNAIFASTFEDMVILEWKKMGRARWKLELIDLVFSIAKEIIPDDVVSQVYTSRIRELYVFQLGKAWDRILADGGEDQAKSESTRLGLLNEYDYRSVLFLTGQCLEAMGPIAAGKKENFQKAWFELLEPSKSEHLTWKSLTREKDNNIVIEMTWLITNTVGGICHNVFDYAHNFWALYIHLINEMYLIPVLPEWKKQIDDIDILLGMDMEIQYNKLALFTSLSMFAANGLEPFERPRNPVFSATTEETAAEAEADPSDDDATPATDPEEA